MKVELLSCLFEQLRGGHALCWPIGILGAQVESCDNIGDDIVQIVQSLVDSCERLDGHFIGGRLFIRWGSIEG